MLATQHPPRIEILGENDAKKHLSNINAYYDSTAVQLFERIAKQQIHLGYWDDRYPYVSLEQAARRLTQVVIDYIGLPKDGLFLDIGCGCGGPAIDIAKQKQCYVEGITINQQQKEKAESLAHKENLAHRVTFKLADASHLPYASQVFDGVLLLESIHHIGHQTALEEAFRVLKKGGEIVIADGAAMQENASNTNKQILGDIFVSKSVVTPSQLKQMMRNMGFELQVTLDLTQAVLPTWNKLMQETEQQRKSICNKEGIAFYQDLMAFWSDIQSLWRDNAQYLLYKGIKN